MSPGMSNSTAATGQASMSENSGATDPSPSTRTEIKMKSAADAKMAGKDKTDSQ
jgi:hypothetical protein